jgi:hypothetical protein
VKPITLTTAQLDAALGFEPYRAPTGVSRDIGRMLDRFGVATAARARAAFADNLTRSRRWAVACRRYWRLAGSAT